MSGARMTVLTLSTRNVSVDGAAVCPGDDAGPCDLEAGRVLETLRAFAGLPPMDLVETEARIFLSGPRGKVAVQNVGGRLFVAELPESVNTAAERTPEQTLDLLISGKRESATASGGEVVMTAAEDLVAAAPKGKGRLKQVLNSGWVLAALLVIAAAMAWATYRPSVPEGVTMIGETAKISALNTKLDGRYGAPPATVLVLASGKLTGVQLNAATGAEEPRFQFSYRYGQIGERLVLVVSNGALLELQPNGGLKFLESVYPRIAK